MGFWKNVKALFTPDGPQPQESSSVISNNPTTGMTNWTNSDYWNGHNGMLRSNEEIFGVISRLANTVSSLPIHEFKNYSTISNSVSDLLEHEANPSLSSFELINQLEVSRNTEGNAYAWIERDERTGTPIHLWPIDPGSVIVMRNSDDNSIWYRIDDTEGHHFYLFNTDIIHVKHISPLTGVLGISPLDVLRGSLRFKKAVEDFSLTEMSKKDAYIIKYDRGVDPERRQAMIEDFRRMIKENGGAVVQEKGFEYDRFESKFQPSDLSTTDSITRSRIATAFNVPLSFVNEGSTNNGKSNEQLMIQFVQMTLLPIVKQYESEFNRKLLTPRERAQGTYFKFNVNGLMRGDTQARTDFYQSMIRNGIATSNDLRKLEELPPSDEPNADKLWITGDLYPLDLDPEKRNTSKGGETGGSNQDDKESAQKLKRQAGE